MAYAFWRGDQSMRTKDTLICSEAELFHALTRNALRISSIVELLKNNRIQLDSECRQDMDLAIAQLKDDWSVLKDSIQGE